MFRLSRFSRFLGVCFHNRNLVAPRADISTGITKRTDIKDDDDDDPEYIIDKSEMKMSKVVPGVTMIDIDINTMYNHIPPVKDEFDEWNEDESEIAKVAKAPAEDKSGSGEKSEELEVSPEINHKYTIN